RDLKPENVVLVRGPGGEPWAKLIDFGIARLGPLGPAALRQTMQGTVMGTPYYMAPEQARGSLDVDGRADLYALGVMLYEMVTGKLPFTGRDSTEVLTRVLSEPFPSARALDESIAPALDDAIGRATARRREQRFGSAAEFAEALRPLRPELVAVQLVSDDEPDGAREVTAVRRLAELTQRSGTWRTAGLTPPRLSVAPPLPGRGSRAPTPPRSTPPSRPRLSLTPPAIRPEQTSVVPPRNAVVVSRWAVLLGATLGVAALAAGVAALLVVLADRPRNPTDAGAEHVSAASGEPGPTLDEVAERARRDAESAAPAVPVPAAVPLAVPAPPAPPPVPAPPPTTPPGGPDPAAPDPAVPAVVRLVGLPAGARATLDGRPVEAEFTVEVSETTHTLRVVLHGHRPFVREFRATGDLALEVRLEPLARTAPADRTADDDRAPSPRPLANPFGGR
ncbi:MAG: serine/threonine protein kinase, partial [Deltaproteobacteria bacterium]|nr:serine/threonine protein kinase [Deltaproteobacteria bacterium]